MATAGSHHAAISSRAWYTEPAGVYLAHIRGHHLAARVARFGQRRPLEPDTAGVFWTLMLITLLVVWISGVQPVLADKDSSPLTSTQIYQLSVSPPTVPSLYPLVTEQAAAAQTNSQQVWHLQNPVVWPRAHQQDKNGFAQSALRAVRAN